MRLRRDADATLDVLVLLQHAEAWRNEDAAAGEACGGGDANDAPQHAAPSVSRLRAACDAVRLLAADAAPETLGVSMWRAGASARGSARGSGSSSRGSNTGVVPVGATEATWAPRLRCLEALACAAGADGAASLPPLCAALRRAALALKCRAPTPATATVPRRSLGSGAAGAHHSARPSSSSSSPPPPRHEAALLLVVCDAGCVDDADVAKLADAAAAVRAAGARIHIVFADGGAASSRGAAAARAALVDAARCGARGQGDCLWPLACDACGCCVPLPDADDVDASPLDDDLSAYGGAAPAAAAAAERRCGALSVCEALREAGALRGGAAVLRDAWAALYGSGGGDHDEDAPPPFPLPAPPAASSAPPPPPSPPPHAPLLAPSGCALHGGCSEAAAVGDALQYGAGRVLRASLRPRPPLREFLRVVIAPPPGEESAGPAVAYTICVDSLARVAEALMTPRAAVRAARLLECFGAAPGALRGQRRLAPEPRAGRARSAHPGSTTRPQQHSSRIALWLRADGTYELTYERNATAGAALTPASPAEAAPEVLAILPPHSSSSTSSSWLAPRVSRLAADPSGRAFALDAGAGAGRRRRFFWLRAASLAQGLEELSALDAALSSSCGDAAQCRPTLTQLTGVPEEELARMAAAAPALLTHLLALQAARPGERDDDDDDGADGMEAPVLVPSRMQAPRQLPPLRGLPPLGIARRESARVAAAPPPPPAAVVAPRPALPVQAPPQPLPPPPLPPTTPAPAATAAAWCLGGVDLAETETEAEARLRRERCCALAQAESIMHARRTATAAAAAAAAPPASPATPPPPPPTRVKGAVTLSNLRDALQHAKK
jgi:hypothetical protein